MAQGLGTPFSPAADPTGGRGGVLAGQLGSDAITLFVSNIYKYNP